MRVIDKHIISADRSINDVLARLNALASDAIIFVVDANNKLIGSLTDGDIRRGLLKGLNLDHDIREFIQPNPKFLRKEEFNVEKLKAWRNLGYKIIPVVDSNDEVVKIINFRIQKSYLPIDAIIMAGGEGKRLRPLTLTTPKPMLKVGDKPILEHNIDHLKNFGINNIYISIKYLGDQIVNYFGDGSNKQLKISYIEENEPLGTIGAAGNIQNNIHDYILVMNSDLLTNINLEDMFYSLLTQKSEMIVASTPYDVQIPYGVIESEGFNVLRLEEKPTYTYYSNAGIYIFKKEIAELIPKNKHFNATDLMEFMLKTQRKVSHFPILDYWLDIGKKHDFEKAQKEINQIRF